MIAAVDEDVLRLQIAVGDPDIMRGGEPRQKLEGKLPGALDRQCPLSQDAREVGSLDVRHRDVLDAGGVAHVVDPNDIGMGDLPREEKLLLEPPLVVTCGLGIGHHLRPNDLQRDREAQLLVQRFVDGAHAADAEHPVDPIPAGEQAARREHTAPGGAALRI